jgi:O-antigen/teichoic acid export membrane protein
MSREILRDVFFYLPAKVVPALVGVIAIPVLTHFLSAEQYGKYILAMTSLSLIAALCISWLVSITIRFYVIYGIQTLFQKSCRLIVYSILLASTLWLGASQLLEETLGGGLLIAAGLVWLIAYGVFEYFSGWLRSRNLPLSYSLAMSWRSLAGLLIVVVLFNLGFQGGAIVVLGFAIAMLIGLFFLPSHALNGDSLHLKSEELKLDVNALLGYGIPVAISNMVIVGLSIADRYIINYQMGVESVAIYSANYDLAEKTIFFVNSILLLSSSVIGFRIFEREGEAKAADFLSSLMRLYLLVAPPLVLALAILSASISKILLPDQYHSGAFVVPVVATGGLLVGVLHRYSLVLSFNKRNDIIMWCSACALLVNIISCFLLIPKYGILGAAYSTLIAYALWLIFIRLAASMYSPPQFPWSTFFRVCSALLITAMAIYCIKYQELTSDLSTLALSFVFGFIAYGLTLFLLKEFTLNEVKSICSIIFTRFNKAR